MEVATLADPVRLLDVVVVETEVTVPLPPPLVGKLRLMVGLAAVPPMLALPEEPLLVIVPMAMAWTVPEAPAAPVAPICAMRFHTRGCVEGSTLLLLASAA